MYRINQKNQKSSNMDQKEAISKATDYKNLLKEHFHFTDIYLFGSYASNEFDSNSDIDIAVVVDKTDEDFFSITPKLWKLRREVDDRIEPILVETDLDKSGFYEDIVKKGIRIN